jgi:hypothetical protein
MEEPKRNRIGWISGSILVFLALCADLIGLIPLMESFSATIFWLVAGVILWMCGCGLLNWKRLVTAGTSLAIGWVPAIQSLPQITLGILVIIIIVKMEDKTGKSFIKQLSQPGVRQPNRVPPLNQNSVRLPRRGNIEPADVGTRNTNDEEISLSE